MGLCPNVNLLTKLHWLRRNTEAVFVKHRETPSKDEMHEFDNNLQGKRSLKQFTILVLSAKT